MQLKLLIDGIVQQTTVLVARLSTNAGARSPLGRVADQVFLELARELENQGVAKVLVADMFGLALRSYQRKTQRLTESVSTSSRTLWEAVYSFIRSAEATRGRIDDRFRNDGEREVAAVLADLVRSGLVYFTGTGSSAVYGVNDEKVRAVAQNAYDREALVHYAWFRIFHQEVTTADELRVALPCGSDEAQAVLSELCDSGRVVERDGRLIPVNLVIPLDAPEGIETSLLDHYRAVATVVADRVANGADPTRRSGGSTFSFKLDANHPHYEEVVSLLARTRAQTQELWERVMAVNEAVTPSDDAVKVTFYVGQSIVEQSSEGQVPYAEDISSSETAKAGG
jgi:hypothetical protein